LRRWRKDADEVAAFRTAIGADGGPVRERQIFLDFFCYLPAEPDSPLRTISAALFGLLLNRGRESQWQE
jgi:hypothetical protein